MKEKLDEVKKTLPKGVEVETVYDRTELVGHVIDTVRKNLFEGGLLVIAVLFIFLGNLRAGLIVAAAIPLAMLFAFVGMWRFGIAASLLSLGALDFGLVVDSSVVMVENVVRHLSHGEADQRPHQDVVRDAAIEVRTPTMFGELIIMIVYLPILTLEGVEGGALRRADVRVPVVDEEVDVPHVLVEGRYVPVTHQGHLGTRVLRDELLGVGLQALQPLEFVGHVFVVQGTAVGDVEAPDADSGAGCCHGAGLLDRVLARLAEGGLVQERPLNVLQPHAGGDGNSVPLVYAEVGHLVAHALKEFPREVVVLAFGLLDGQDVAVAALKPGLNAVGAGTERVHIPGSYLHSS